MKKAALSSSLNLVISVIIISFIITIGFVELNHFLKNRNNQIFQSNVLEIKGSVDYLIESNALGSFTTIRLKLPSNQSIIFNNVTNNLTLNGVFEKEIDLNADILNYLELEESGDYSLILCYECNSSKEYVVRIG